MLVKRIWVFPLWAYLSCHSLAAQPQLSSDEAIELDEKEQSFLARGNATLTDGDLVISADKIHYSRKLKQARAEGNVRLTRGNFRLVGNALQYELTDGRFEAQAFKLGIPPIFAEGEALNGTIDEMVLTDTTVYFQEPGPFVPNLRWIR